MARNVDKAKSALEGFGRFSEPALLVLASLAASPKHGYAIIQDVEAHAGERLGPGTLYGAIARLEKLEFIKPLDMEERGRRPYRITPAGRRAFEERMQQLKAYHTLLRGLAAQ